MSWVAVGVTAVGAGASYMASQEAGEAAEQAAQTQSESADRAAQLQREMFQQQQAYLAPYRQAGYTAAPLLEYLTTGIMPTLTPEEQSILGMGGEPGPIGNFGQIIGTTGRPTTASNVLASKKPVVGGAQNAMTTGGGYTREQALATAQQAMPQFSPTFIGSRLTNKMMQKYAQSPEVQALPTEQGLNLDQIRREQLLGKQRAIQAAQGGLQGLIEQNPLYQYQRDIGEKSLNRMLAARGRGNSTFGINALTAQNRALTAQSAQDVYNRIANLSNVGQGIGAQLGQNAMTAGTNLGNLALGAGQATAQGQLEAGQQRASLYSNLGALPMQAYGQYQLINALKG